MSNINERYTDESVLDVDFFREDINEMYNDTQKMGELADKISDDIDELYYSEKGKESLKFKGRNTLTFVSEQIKNLTSLRVGKANSMNQIISNKLKISKLALDKSNKNNDSSSSAEEIAREFQKLFVQNGNYSITPSEQVKINASLMEDKSIDDELEKRVKELQDSGELTFTDNELAIKYENDGYRFCIRKNTNGEIEFVPVNNVTNEMIEDLPKSLYPNPNLLENLTFNNNKYISTSGLEYEYVY